MKVVLQFSACLALGVFVALLILVGLMFTSAFGVIDGLVLTGKPLASLSLTLLPDSVWSALTGVQGAAQNASVQSFLQFCAALGQLALLLGAGLFRGCCWR
ncbi:hypothetical protein D3879_03305 [Pseudomonas cavernicola]|uniref:Uncharacterized protein n=1 Tax=Pseudomonas cavernicola TaxID=2320866 RepID=A0A418XIN0_9PSED|nr:hypothetical protein [Pseudomonas cavernicola]RJG12338.1 hypothetical protein D3879_03305 [Pseudomonas cavernicola]